MKGLRWFQTKVGLFQDPRIMYLLNQPHGDSYFVIWFYLKDLAGMINDDGSYTYRRDRLCRRSCWLVGCAARRPLWNGCWTFEQIDLISRDERG